MLRLFSVSLLRIVDPQKAHPQESQSSRGKNEKQNRPWQAYGHHHMAAHYARMAFNASRQRDACMHACMHSRGGELHGEQGQMRRQSVDWIGARYDLQEGMEIECETGVRMRALMARHHVCDGDDDDGDDGGGGDDGDGDGGLVDNATNMQTRKEGRKIY
jgi:hypothetical protein